MILLNILAVNRLLPFSKNLNSGIPVFHSRDLVNWQQIGNAIERPEQFNFSGLGIARAIFAPTIRWHDGVFYIVGTCEECGFNFIMSAIDPAGPWSNPTWLQSIDGVDPDLFVDSRRQSMDCE